MAGNKGHGVGLIIALRPVEFEIHADSVRKLAGITPAARMPVTVTLISLAFSQSAVLMASTKGSQLF